MLENLTLLLYCHPSFSRAAGAALYKVGGLGLVVGAFAQVGKLAASIATNVAGQPPVMEVARLLPGVWTWWIPESVAGATVYLALAGSGAWLSFVAKDAERHLRAR